MAMRHRKGCQTKEKKIIMQEAANKKIVYLGVLRIIIWEPHILVEAE